jgi:hypothetical protein
VAEGEGVSTAYRKEEVADVVGNVDGQTNVGEVEAIAEGNEGKRDNVMANELLEVLARLLHAQQQDDGLLSPVGGLEEVVEFEVSRQRLVRIGLVHAARVKVPDGCARHDVHAGGTKKGKVDSRVHLLHEAGLLAPRAHSTPARHRSQQLVHDELAREGQQDGVEGNKSNIP